MYWSFPEWPTACEILSAFQYGQMPHCRSKCSKPRAAIEWFYFLKRLEHFDVRSMVDKSTDHGNQFINFLQ